MNWDDGQKGKNVFFFPFEIILECEGVDKGPVQCFIYLLFYVICSYLFSGGGVEVVGEGVGFYSDISLVGECSRPERQRAKERSLSFQNCNFKSRKKTVQDLGEIFLRTGSPHIWMLLLRLPKALAPTLVGTKLLLPIPPDRLRKSARRWVTQVAVLQARFCAVTLLQRTNTGLTKAKSLFSLNSKCAACMQRVIACGITGTSLSSRFLTFWTVESDNTL